MPSVLGGINMRYWVSIMTNCRMWFIWLSGLVLRVHSFALTDLVGPWLDFCDNVCTESSTEYTPHYEIIICYQFFWNSVEDFLSLIECLPYLKSCWFYASPGTSRKQRLSLSEFLISWQNICNNCSQYTTARKTAATKKENRDEFR